VRRARVLLVALILAGCGAERPATTSPAGPAPGWTTVLDARHGLTVSLPSAWHRAARSLTPALTDPHEVLTLATFPLRGGPHRRCAQVPEQAVRDVGARDVLVSLLERRDPGSEFTPGPPALGPAAPGDHALCAGRRGELEEHWSTFALGGRGFYLYAALGRDVSAGRRAQLDRVLGSLRVDPLVRHGSFAVLPPEGWTVVEAPLTGFDELAVASFGVPRGRSDANCTPRRAIDAMPPDGAWLYVTVADGPGEERARPSGAEVLARPARPYECRGVSRRASWTEQGTGVLANLYLGPDASPARRAQLERAFDSLVVRE
jgi:hypothetical protein